MTDCKDREAQISALVDGTLSDDERDELTRHIAECERCSAVFAAFAALSDAICDDEELPEGLHESIMAAVKAEKPVKAKKSSRSPLKTLLCTAACAALIILSCSLIPDLLPGSVNETADSAHYADGFGKQENDSCLIGNENGTKHLSAADTERLRSLLAPSDEGTDACERLPDNAICISIFGENDELICTVSVFGDKVYADFGDGDYLTSCSTEELEIVLND